MAHSLVRVLIMHRFILKNQPLFDCILYIKIIIIMMKMMIHVCVFLGFESILEGIYGPRLLQDLSIFVSELFFMYLTLKMKLSLCVKSSSPFGCSMTRSWFNRGRRLET